MWARFVLASAASVLVLFLLRVWLLRLLDVSDIVGTPELEANTSASAADGFDFITNRSTQYQAGMDALKVEDYGRALRELSECEPQDGACLGLLAEMHLVGAGVPRNYTEGARLFAAGAELGDPESQYAMAVLHANPTSEELSDPNRNEGLSVLHMYAASIAGHPGALMSMAYRHTHGLGVPKACTTAALNYIEVARRVADVYSAGLPQAVELVRLGVNSRDKKPMTTSEVDLFVEIAASGDPNIAAAVGKRYLLGIEGFRQNYQKAAQHLRVAAEKNHGVAMALLGYMYCLGLGVARSLDVAYSYFMASAVEDDPLGHNGLGYIYFTGTPVQEQDFKLALKHFNSSAHGGSADGMFNLASLYLTGTGSEQSFQRAAFWYTQALDRGHTPAAYTLGVMHLNGVGTVKNCKIAVDLLKKVCERSNWVSEQLQQAYHFQRTSKPDSAAWLFLRLAEAGHEVAQVNFAHLADTGSSQLLFTDADPTEPGAEAQALGRTHAQRQYELSAQQGNALAELRLGDYAYNGWGLKTDNGLHESTDEPTLEEEVRAVSSEELHLVPQEADVELSLAIYKRTATMKVNGDWMQPFVARANFNLGYMHQFGVGVDRNTPQARHYYHRCAEVDPFGVQTPVAVMLTLLALQTFLAELPSPDMLWADARTHVLAVHVIMLAALLNVRSRYIRLVMQTPRLDPARSARGLGRPASLVRTAAPPHGGADREAAPRVSTDAVFNI